MTVSFQDSFPIWAELSETEQKQILSELRLQAIAKESVLHSGSEDCLGLLLLASGQLRVYMLSEEGKEITLYRLFPGDLCLFSASCRLESLQQDTIVEAEQDSEYWLIPAVLSQDLLERSLPISKYVNKVMAARFAEVIWLMEQIMWKSVDRRLAAFLINESELIGGDQLQITHERIASHLGTAREVVTRMLRYFQAEGLIHLNRGKIVILNRPGLKKTAD